MHTVDEAAESLGVHVRRIYELLKILQLLSLVKFSGIGQRGQFIWNGTRDLIQTLGKIQDDAIAKHPSLAAAFHQRSPLKSSDSVEASAQDALLLPPPFSADPCDYMLENTCRKFLTLFLAGLDGIPMSLVVRDVVWVFILPLHLRYNINKTLAAPQCLCTSTRFSPTFLTGRRCAPSSPAHPETRPRSSAGRTPPRCGASTTRPTC